MVNLHDIRFNEVSDGYAIAGVAGTSYNPITDQIIARVTPRGNLMGGVLFSYWTGLGGSINMHVAGFHPRWISRTMLNVCFDYPFNQLGVRKIFGQVPMDNHHAIRFNEHLGFRKEAVIPDAYPGGKPGCDMQLMSLYKDQCRFIGSVSPLMIEA
jgi:RimJ/RimL family protein N-acetyltransferase